MILQNQADIFCIFQDGIEFTMDIQYIVEISMEFLKLY